MFNQILNNLGLANFITFVVTYISGKINLISISQILTCDDAMRTCFLISAAAAALYGLVKLANVSVDFYKKINNNNDKRKKRRSH